MPGGPRWRQGLPPNEERQFTAPSSATGRRRLGPPVTAGEELAAVVLASFIVMALSETDLVVTHENGHVAGQGQPSFRRIFRGTSARRLFRFAALIHFVANTSNVGPRRHHAIRTMAPRRPVSSVVDRGSHVPATGQYT